MKIAAIFLVVILRLSSSLAELAQDVKRSPQMCEGNIIPRLSDQHVLPICSVIFRRTQNQCNIELQQIYLTVETHVQIKDECGSETNTSVRCNCLERRCTSKSALIRNALTRLNRVDQTTMWTEDCSFEDWPPMFSPPPTSPPTSDSATTAISSSSTSRTSSTEMTTTTETTTTDQKEASTTVEIPQRTTGKLGTTARDHTGTKSSTRGSNELPKTVEVESVHWRTTGATETTAVGTTVSDSQLSSEATRMPVWIIPTICVLSGISVFSIAAALIFCYKWCKKGNMENWLPCSRCTGYRELDDFLNACSECGRIDRCDKCGDRPLCPNCAHMHLCQHDL